MGVGGSVIDELFIALGIQVDQSGFRNIRQQVDEAKSSLLSIGTAVKAFVAGFAIKEVADIGSTFEQNQIQIAGFLSALGQSSDFTQGLQDAQGVIQQITKDAAILPGEAQEYIDVFKAGLPFVQAAMPGGSLGDITKFTNQLTAIGKTFGLDSGLIAREFDHMLSPGKGMASLRLPLFRQLLSFMPKLAGGARVTAESFNAMSAPQRLALLQSTFEKLQPMLDASANSFDAMWGAAVSALKQMTRVATVPLFKAFKEALDKVNGALYDASGQQTAFGKSITESMSTGLKYIVQLLGAGGKLVVWLANSKAGAIAFKWALGLLGTALTGLAVSKTIDSFKKLFGVLTNIRALLTGGLFIAIGLIAEDLYVWSQGGESVTGKLLNKLIPAIDQMRAAIILLGAGLVAAGLAGSPLLALVVILAALGLEIYTLATRWDEFVGGMKAIWEDFVQSVLDGVNSVTEALGMGDIFETNKKKDKDLDNRYAQQLAILRARKGTNQAGTPLLAQKAGRPEQNFVESSPWAPMSSFAAAGPGGAAPWSPGAQASPMVASGGDTTITHQTTNHVTVNVKSTDPKSAGREVQKALIRNSQSAVKY